MCRSSKSVRLMFIIAASLVVFVARHPALVEGLEEKEEIVEDFNNGTAYYWQGYRDDNSSTIWYLSTHGDPAPFDLGSIRPPMEENGGGFIEVVPFSDSPAQIYTDVFDLLPGATAELTYWNLIPFPVFGRHTVLILYTEFVDVIEGRDDALEKSVQVFTAPMPTDPSPGWTTVTVELKINQRSKVRLRLDGNRADLDGTGLAISKIVIKNGEERSTTSTSTTTMTSTSTVTSPVTESQTETSSTILTTTRGTSFSTPSKLDVEKSTSTEVSTTATTLLAMTTTSPSTTTIIYLPSSTSTSTLSSSAETTSLNTENTPTSSSTSVSPTSSSSTESFNISPSLSITSTIIHSTTSQSSSTSSVELTNPSTSSSESTTFTSERTSTISTGTSTITTMPSSNITSPSSIMSTTKTTPSSATSSSTTPSPGTAQLRGIAIGVSLSIIFLVSSCLLLGFLYRRHRRRVYLIEKSQLEAGTIRQLEQSDNIPSFPHKADVDNCSISSTTSSSAPLVKSEISSPLSPQSIVISTT
ncbi:hypothetical protein GHT06_017246 [Daphnia sinensis]|uniref:Uncharacterized protein n=1 Tax=Daphnia sinensis TaxID=1820382 RepID=A0AAD5LGU4_9CRUS|nr:hypothetical protein GHT06_017246 [Daphnia sinensis]